MPCFTVELLPILLCSSLACGQDAQAQQPPAQAAPLQQLPWPIQLGYRTAALERSWPVADQVVLVPDGRTYLDELAKWNEHARWPVLIEDDFYTPLFVRGFAPKRVIRRPSIGVMPSERAEREALVSKSAADAIADGATDITDALLKRNVPPSMIVLTDAMDPAWTAAAALAAGRCAPIHFSSEKYGLPQETLSDAGFRRLANELEVGAERTNLPWKGLGDAIDAFVIFRGRRRPNFRREVASRSTPVRFPPSPASRSPRSTRSVVTAMARGGRWVRAFSAAKRVVRMSR